MSLLEVICGNRRQRVEKGRGGGGGVRDEHETRDGDAALYPSPPDTHNPLLALPRVSICQPPFLGPFRLLFWALVERRDYVGRRAANLDSDVGYIVHSNRSCSLLIPFRLYLLIHLGTCRYSGKNHLSIVLDEVIGRLQKTALMM